AFLILFCLLASGAHALCGQQEQLYMSCEIAGRDTHVSICFDEDRIYYRYGTVDGVPELELEEPLASVSYIPSSRIGQSVWDEVRFGNGQYTYKIETGFLTDRENLLEGEWPPAVRFGDIRWGGIDVLRGGEILAELVCEFETINFNQVDLMEALGIDGVAVWEPWIAPE
ncbi:MAG: hypothetical protein WAO67_12500, partial [Yoonia sp.]